MADVPVGEPGAFGRFYQKVATRSTSIYRSYVGSEIHARGIRMVKNDLTIGAEARNATKGKLGTLTKWLGRGFYGYAAYEGYQEGGIFGAAKNVAATAAVSYAFGTASPILLGASVVAGGAAVGVLGGIGLASMSEGVSPLQLLTRRRVREHQRKNANLEMGAPVNDPHGNLATMRQRSLAAMQNSRLSGMNALGYEAQINYSRYQVRR